MQHWKRGDTVRGGNVSIDEDYKRHLRKAHDGSIWGATGNKYSGEWVRGLLRDRPYLQSVLDFGAGKGTLGAGIQGVAEWVDYDPGIPGKDVLPNRQFDMVVSTDCLEHVEPTHIEATIVQIGSRAKKVVALDIPCYATGNVFSEGPYEGQDYHLIVKPPDWWKAITKKYLPEFQMFSCTTEERMSKGKYRRRVRLVYERL